MAMPFRSNNDKIFIRDNSTQEETRKFLPEFDDDPCRVVQSRYSILGGSETWLLAVTFEAASRYYYLLRPFWNHVKCLPAPRRELLSKLGVRA